MLDIGALSSVAGVTAGRAILAKIEQTARSTGDIPLANAARFRMLQIDGERSSFPRRQLDWIFYEQLAGYLVRPLRPLRTLLFLILVGTVARYLVDDYRAPPRAGRRGRDRHRRPWCARCGSATR